MRWARFLVEDVFLDLCGFPLVLRSDRGAAYTGKVIAEVTKLLGISHRMGSAWHPESQGYIEGRHKPINQIIRAYAAAHPENWSTVLRYAQWSLRAIPREDRQGRSPFELVTGLKPQGLSDSLFRKIGGRSLNPAGYVAILQSYLHRVHSLVKTNSKASWPLDNKDRLGQLAHNAENTP